METSQRVCFDDTFKVLTIDSERFDKVSRIKAQAQTFLADIEVDINTDIYPIKVGDTVSIAVATTGEEAAWDSAASRLGGGLLDAYDYVMFGKVYKKVDGSASKVSVYASFGGLLMCLQGDRSDLDGLHLDDRVYFLLKTVA
jgi:DNA-directed RNA polymerases I, II, and III subunit RPABC3